MNYLKKIGTKDNPTLLKTPPGSSEYTMHLGKNKEGTEVIVCTVGKTVLHYDIRSIQDLHKMLLDYGDWMLLGSKDEKVLTKEGTVEHWARSSDNPIGGWYGLKKNLRGRFAMYIPPLMEHLELVELEHNKRNNRIRAILKKD